MKAAVLGTPISHSRSPLLHMAAYAALGLDWTYDRHEVDAAGLAGFLHVHRHEYRGLSLTMPLKDVAFEIAEEHDADARATSACNTLTLDGTIKGYNTDVIGFIEALRYREVSNVQNVVILGTGATARSAAVAMLRLGANGLTVVGRRPEACIEFSTWFAGLGGRIAPVTWDEAPHDADVTISTTPAGATDSRNVPVTPGILFDVVYSPWPTGYAARWENAGGTTISGLDLLVHQAAQQVLIMTGVDEMQRARIVEAMYGALADE